MTTPYVEHRDSDLWKTVEQAISDLVTNKDIKELTPREYIVGYIVKRIADHGAR